MLFRKAATNRSSEPALSLAMPGSTQAISAQLASLQHADGTMDYHERIVLPPLLVVATNPETTAPPRSAQSPRASAYGAVGGTPRPGSRVNILLAVLQVLVGYQWLVSGVDKVLWGQFPDQLSQLVTTSLGSGHLPDIFAQFLRDFVLPNASVFGIMVEYGEALAGLGLLAGAALTLGRPLLQRRMQASGESSARFMRLALGGLGLLTAGAALGAFFMGLNYWVLDGMPAPWFTPGLAYGGAVHPALFLALASATILVGHLAGLIAGRRSGDRFMAAEA